MKSKIQDSLSSLIGRIQSVTESTIVESSADLLAQFVDVFKLARSANWSVGKVKTSGVTSMMTIVGFDEAKGGEYPITVTAVLAEATGQLLFNAIPGLIMVGNASIHSSIKPASLQLDANNDDVNGAAKKCAEAIGIIVNAINAEIADYKKRNQIESVNEANPYHSTDDGKFTGPEQINKRNGGSWSLGGVKAKLKKGKKGQPPRKSGAPDPCGGDARDRGGDIRCWDGTIKRPVSESAKTLDEAIKKTDLYTVKFSDLIDAYEDYIHWHLARADYWNDYEFGKFNRQESDFNNAVIDANDGQKIVLKLFVTNKDKSPQFLLNAKIGTKEINANISGSEIIQRNAEGIWSYLEDIVLRGIKQLVKA